MKFVKRVNRLFRRYLPATIGLFVFSCQCATALPQSKDAIHAPPGLYRTSWIGNSFGGNGGPNGEGFWVQQGADEIEVTVTGLYLLESPGTKQAVALDFTKTARSTAVC